MVLKGTTSPSSFTAEDATIPRNRWGRRRQVSEIICNDETVKASTSTTVLHQMDVLFCFDPEISSDHVGNTQFYHLVDYNKSIYQALPKRKHLLVARSIVHAITRGGGRFLRQEKLHIGSRNVTHWAKMNFVESILKTVEALSDCNTSMIVPPVALLLSYGLSSSLPVASVAGLSLGDPVAEKRNTCFEQDGTNVAGGKSTLESHEDEDRSNALTNETQKNEQSSALYRRFKLWSLGGRKINLESKDFE